MQPERVEEEVGMLLSLIIPTYNCREYLYEGLDSVISQIPDNCELIVVDDGSTDGTSDMVQAYDGKYINVKVRLAGHQGVSGARNIGLDMAEGQYITFMDCDDCMIEGNINRYLEEVTVDADLHIYGFIRETLDGGKHLNVPEERYFDSVSDFVDDIIRGQKYLIYSNCNKLYKKSIIDKLSLRFELNTNFGEDRLFNYNYLPACKTVASHNRPSCRYMERSAKSLSTRAIPDYMTLIKRLHEEKIKCYFSLSKGTSPEEKEKYRIYDWETEMKKAPGMTL